MQQRPNDTTSAYNEGMLQIERLHWLWTQANNQSRSGKYLEWRWTLDVVWRELTRDAIKNTDGKLTPGNFQEIELKNPWFKEYNDIDNKIDNAKNFRETYLSLSRLEIFLRCLQDAVGKGGKYKDTDEDFID